MCRRPAPPLPGAPWRACGGCWTAPPSAPGDVRGRLLPSTPRGGGALSDTDRRRGLPAASGRHDDGADVNLARPVQATAVSWGVQVWGGGGGGGRRGSDVRWSGLERALRSTQHAPHTRRDGVGGGACCAPPAHTRTVALNRRSPHLDKRRPTRRQARPLFQWGAYLRRVLAGHRRLPTIGGCCWWCWLVVTLSDGPSRCLGRECV